MTATSTLIHLATLATGEEIYWESSSGTVKPTFTIIKDGKVGVIPLNSLKTLVLGQNFAVYHKNIWF